jgi:hypothetical protein
MDQLEVPLLLQRARGLVKIYGLDPEANEVHQQVSRVGDGQYGVSADTICSVCVCVRAVEGESVVL